MIHDLQINNLYKNYDNIPILKDINLEASKGEFITLLGPSGCGKSTLLRCIAGLTSFEQGSILIKNREISSLSPQNRNIGMVFQSYSLFPNMTVFENIAFGLKIRKFHKHEIEKKIDHILELVELNKFVDKYPSQLSGGQCQRVALARVLVLDPDLLLLDEPLSALDARIRKKLRLQIKKIQKELNITTIFVTHDQEEALIMSDRIVLMNQGNIVQNNNADTIYLKPNSEFAAGFIGNYNILESNEASFLFKTNYNNKIAIRPESIQLEKYQNDPNKIMATIENRILLGNIIRYSLTVQDIKLDVDMLNLNKNSLIDIGCLVNLNIEDQAIIELN